MSLNSSIENNSMDKYLLGISCFYHDSAATLLKNGEIIGAVQEERFTRIKGDASFPLESITFLLAEAKITPDELDAVIFYESPYLKFNRLLSTLLLGRIRSLPLFLKATLTWLNHKLWVEKEIKKYLGKKTQIIFLDHHLSHASSAYYPSPYDDAAVLTVDGVGEWSTTTIGKGLGNQLTLLEEIQFPNSLGLLYSAFTHYCGFKINSGEYKLMGLAPFGEPKYVEQIKKEIIHLDDNGSYALNPLYFSFDKEERTYNKKFVNLWGHPPRTPDTPIRKIDQDLAASIQVVLNEALANLANRAQVLTNSKNLVLAGGVALNVVSMGYLDALGIFENIWVQPASGDAGGSLGAALYYHYQVTQENRVANPGDFMQGSLLGSKPGTTKEIEKLLETYELKGHFLLDEDLVVAVSKSLQEKRIIGIAKGRAEFGPRALGSRSIIADARIPQLQSTLNLKIKFREGFRPFAPLLLERFLPTYFNTNLTSSPYMLKTFKFRDAYCLNPDTSREDIIERVKGIRSAWPAITHLDYSARVQTVDPIRHEFLSKVMEDFYQATKSPFLVNTSFNVRGEPIVNSATDALECFLATDIDVLVLENYIIYKHENLQATPKKLRKFAVD